MIYTAPCRKLKPKGEAKPKMKRKGCSLAPFIVATYVHALLTVAAAAAAATWPKYSPKNLNEY